MPRASGWISGICLTSVLGMLGKENPYRRPFGKNRRFSDELVKVTQLCRLISSKRNQKAYKQASPETCLSGQTLFVSTQCRSLRNSGCKVGRFYGSLPSASQTGWERGSLCSQDRRDPSDHEKPATRIHPEQCPRSYRPSRHRPLVMSPKRASRSLQIWLYERTGGLPSCRPVPQRWMRSLSSQWSK